MRSRSPDSGASGEDDAFERGDEPLALFNAWFEEARASEPDLAEAASLATAGADGWPDVRMVLIKAVDQRGFVFYTNLESRKGQELRENPKAALCFHWKSLKRQVRVQGTVEPVAEAEADAYFSTRPKQAQIGAWASRQSRPLRGRFELEAEVAKYAAKFALKTIPRPPFWSGYRVRPLRIEFWRQGLFRLHDRRVFQRETEAQPHWTSQRLYP